MDVTPKEQNHPSSNRHHKWFKYRNKKIYHHDFTELREEEMVPAIESTVDTMVARAEADLLILIDLRDVKLDIKALKTFTATSHRSKHLIKKIAVLGIHQIQQAFLNYISNVFGLNIRGFKEFDEAKEWLAD